MSHNFLQILKLFPQYNYVKKSRGNLDNRLNWEEYINKLRVKAKRALNTIKVVTGKKWGRDQKTLKNYTVQYVEQK